MTTKLKPISERDQDERPLHWQIRKHARATMTHREATIRAILRAVDAGIPDIEIAHAAGTTLEHVHEIVNQARALDETRFAPSRG